MIDLQRPVLHVKISYTLKKEEEKKRKKPLLLFFLLKVNWVEQQEHKTRTKRGLIDRETFERSYHEVKFNDPLWDKEWYLVSLLSRCMFLF